MPSRRERKLRQVAEQRKRHYRLWLGRYRAKAREEQRLREAEEVVLQRDSRRVLAMGLGAIFFLLLVVAFT